MLGRVLEQNSKIYTFEELHFFENLVDSKDLLNPTKLDEIETRVLLERLLTSARENIFAKPDPITLAPDVDAILGEFPEREPVSLYKAFVQYEVKKNKRVIPCEQTPRYLFSLDEVFAAFPKARVINMIRDPRDVMLSQKNKWRTYFHGSWDMPASEAFRAWFNYHPILIAKLWSSAVRRAEHYREDPRFISVRFEALLENPENVISKLCDFLEIEFQPEMLLIEDIGSSIIKDKKGEIGINIGAVNRWKSGGLSRSELRICARVAGQDMMKLGYTPTEQPATSLQYMFSWPSLFAKGGMSLIFNLSRNRNIISAIRRRFFENTTKGSTF